MKRDHRFALGMAGRARRLLCALAAALLLSAPATAQAQTKSYPETTVRVVIGYAAGGGGDILARYYAQKLQDISGTPFVVINRPGAAGNLGANFVANAKPDGYTLLLAPNVAFLGNVHAFKNPGYHPINQFEPVAAFARLPFVVAVGPNSQVTSLPDLKRLVLEKKGKATYGGTTTTAIVAAELLLARFGGKATRVPYKSMGDSVGDLESGLDFVIPDSTFAIGQARAGRMKLLAVTVAQRSDAAPDLPTALEQGFPGVDIAAWWAAYAPKGTPKEALGKLEGMFNQISRSDDTRAFLLNVATEPFPSSSQKLGELMAQELKQWGEMIDKAGIEKQ
ncbi:MAG: Bug family tripartite tricarboxylate transporter substrate binding protein [Beijerinckiaceae bacterium]